MKRIIILVAVAFILFQAPTAEAKVMKAEGKVAVATEEQLAKLAGQEKFTNLMGILKKLVQRSPAVKKKDISVNQINVFDFEYLPTGKLKIYYYLN